MSAHSQLVSNQVGAGDEVGRRITANKIFGSISPCCIEIDCLYSLQDVDARRRNTHLEDRGRAIVEVRWTHTSDGCAKFGERTEDPLTIVIIRLNKDIQVLCSTRL